MPILEKLLWRPPTMISLYIQTQLCMVERHTLDLVGTVGQEHAFIRKYCTIMDGKATRVSKATPRQMHYLYKFSST